MRRFWSQLAQSVLGPVEISVRTQQIAYLVSRYGLAEGLAALGVALGQRGLGMARKSSALPKMDAVFGRKLAKLFGKLGPTFVKLGQILASRPDIVGEAVADELRILFDRVPPIPFREVKKLLRKELGKKKFETAFKSIEAKPLASASIGQTHTAVLKDGTPVVLKVQKPGVAETVKLDLRILETIVKPMHALNPKLQLLQMFEDFREATLREIDYRREAANIERFRKNYRSLFSDSEIMFPKYYPDLSTERVLAMEPMRGRKVNEIRRGSTVAKRIATQSLAAVLEQIFDHGFFHADPHAGNLFFLEEEGRLGFIDLGLVGQLEPADKRKFLKVLLAILNRDRAALAKNLYELGTPGPRANYKRFERDIQSLLDEVKKQGIEKVRLEQLLNKLLTVARKNDLLIPNRYVMMIRSCLIIEGVAKSLDPKISVVKVATPIVARSLMKTYNPIAYLRQLW
jgi:ubiquinone biosynthesis protein